MKDAAAFSATFADWKLIKTRGCVQIVLEVPLHQADHAYNVLGGMPDPAKERWVGVARLAGVTPAREAEGVSVPAPAASASRPQEKKRWGEMSPAQQAGVLCAEPAFWAFLREWVADDEVRSEERAIWAVRDYCLVQSRKQIVKGTEAGQKWEDIVDSYRAWMRAPQVAG